MLRKILSSGLLMAAVAAAGAGVVANRTAAQEITAFEGGVITFADAETTVPAELPTGLVKLTFENTGEMQAAPVIARLNEGETPESFGEVMASAEDPMAALGLVNLLGGTLVNPGEAVEVTYDFPVEGDYLVMNFSGGTTFFKVVAGEGAEVEAAATAEAAATEAAAEHAEHVEVQLVDFAFVLPDTLAAGTHTLHIVNAGEQWHEMAIFRITDESLSEAQLMENMMNADPETGTIEGLEEVLVWLPTSADNQAWLDVELEAGQYLVSCFLPDLMDEEMHSHAEKGMVRLLEVTE